MAFPCLQNPYPLSVNFSFLPCLHRWKTSFCMKNILFHQWGLKKSYWVITFTFCDVSLELFVWSQFFSGRVVPGGVLVLTYVFWIFSVCSLLVQPSWSSMKLSVMIQEANTISNKLKKNYVFGRWVIILFVK